MVISTLSMLLLMSLGMFVFAALLFSALVMTWTQAWTPALYWMYVLLLTLALALITLYRKPKPCAEYKEHPSHDGKIRYLLIIWALVVMAVDLGILILICSINGDTNPTIAIKFLLFFGFFAAAIACSASVYSWRVHEHELEIRRCVEMDINKCSLSNIQLQGKKDEAKARLDAKEKSLNDFLQEIQTLVDEAKKDKNSNQQNTAENEETKNTEGQKKINTEQIEQNLNNIQKAKYQDMRKEFADAEKELAQMDNFCELYNSIRSYLIQINLTAYTYRRLTVLHRSWWYYLQSFSTIIGLFVPIIGGIATLFTGENNSDGNSNVRFFGLTLDLKGDKSLQVLLIALPSLSALAANTIIRFRIYDLWLLRDKGRIENERLYAEGKRRLLGSTSFADLSGLNYELTEWTRRIEESQQSGFFSVTETSQNHMLSKKKDE